MQIHYKEILDELLLSYDHETFSVFPDTEVLYFPENESLFIRGSDSITDWAFNLMCWEEKTVGFHWGFYYKARRLFQHLFVDCCIHPEVVLGHSKGGAIAQYIGWMFNIEAYAVACPRTLVGDDKRHYPMRQDFLTWADNKLVIVNQEDDIFSHQPFWGKHPIEPLWLDTTDFPFYAHSIFSFE